MQQTYTEWLMKYLTIENHPNDSRVKIKDDEICQTLSSRMGTGGGNVPLVLVIYEEESIGVLPGTIRENKRYWVSRRDIPNIEGGA